MGLYNDDNPRIFDDNITENLVITQQAVMIRWLAIELAKWELVTDGMMITQELLEMKAESCIETARKATDLDIQNIHEKVEL